MAFKLAAVAATVFRWIARHKEFRDEYTLACELRAEDLSDEMIEIANDPCVWVEKIGADGRAVMVLDHENLARVAPAIHRSRSS
jgi:hypothetical protein